LKLGFKPSFLSAAGFSFNHKLPSLFLCVEIKIKILDIKIRNFIGIMVVICVEIKIKILDIKIRNFIGIMVVIQVVVLVILILKCSI